MSKERELLQRCLDEFEYKGVACNELCIDINKLLAQPEKTEQEPVAWMWTRNYEGGGYTNKVFEFLNDAEEYAKDSKTLKSPDIICPLYTAPPKREPLGLEIMDFCGSEDYREGFKDGALYAEKCHDSGISKAERGLYTSIIEDYKQELYRKSKCTNKEIALRDHFAGLAIQALIQVYVNTGNETPSDDYICHRAYETADTMLKVRDRL